MIKTFNNFITESKYYNEILNPKIWEENKLNSRIEGKLLTIAKDFYNSLNLDVEITDIHLTGSLANFNYNNYSDFDVHILIDFKEVNNDIELVKSSLDGLRFIWNIRHNITIKGYEVELYVQDINEPHTASGLYSLMNSKWINEPKHNIPTIDENEVINKAKTYMRDIDRLKELSKSDMKMNDLDTYFNYAKKLKTKIHQDRKDGLDSKEKEFSIENLVFKELRNSGHFGILIDIINDLYDKQFIQ